VADARRFPSQGQRIPTMATRKTKPIELDGKTGEGGGQLVRVAVCLAAVTGLAIRIKNVRGNRAGGRGGGT